jgi:hypothetical protein
MRLIDGLKKLVDPLGPLGEVVSPSEVYKTRLGLPTQSPHVARARMEAPADVERALALPRFVALGDAHNVPANRVSQVGAYIEEVWAPVYRRTESADLVEILLASQEQIGWQVTQRESNDSRLARKARQNAEEFVEVLQSAQIQATDEFYNGILETVAGNDPIILDGEILRGEATYETNEDGSRGKMIHDGIVRGTMIRGGRKEYNDRTKGYVHWDKGAWEKHLAAEAEMASRPVRNVRRAMEAVAGEALPMWKPTGINFRRDRRSAV